MSKLIYLPLEHIPSRYTVHMDRDITEYLKNSGKEFIKKNDEFISFAELTSPAGRFQIYSLYEP